MLNVVGASGFINATKSRCMKDNESYSQEWTDVMIGIVIYIWGGQCDRSLNFFD